MYAKDFSKTTGTTYQTIRHHITKVTAVKTLNLTYATHMTTHLIKLHPNFMKAGHFAQNLFLPHQINIEYFVLRCYA
jgi:hypothetical protein